MTANDLMELQQSITDKQMASDGAGCPQPSQRFVDSLRRYAIEGVPTGGFLRACLENDLHAAVARADDEALAELRRIIAYIYNVLPGHCWGNKDTVERWLANKRESLAGAAAEWMGISK